MPKNYYMLSSGKLRRDNNSLTMESADGKKKYIPVEDVDSIYLYGEVDLNTKALTFLSSKRIPLHVFNYYGFYSGSYYPREFLNSGHLLVHQVQHCIDSEKRLVIAKEYVRAAGHSILKNVSYYMNRKKSAAGGEDGEPHGEITGEPAPTIAVPKDAALEGVIDASGEPETLANALIPEGGFGDLPESDPFESQLAFDDDVSPLAELLSTITKLSGLIDAQKRVSELMGVEGKIRERYYQSWQHILAGEWAFDRRVRRPPDNEVNALISFGNGVLYTACLSELYRTQLTPTISYLHEPGVRRFSLALDLSEIFKPLIVDRSIFRLLNSGQLKPSHFDRSLGACYLTESGKQLFLKALQDKMESTIMHRRLGRSVSYRHLIRLECYKLIRHLTEVEPYKAFRAWW